MRHARLRRLAAGVSLVELMVAMVIALIGTIIIFQVFEASEGIRRTTTSGGDAQQNGVLGLHVVENDLRNAGMGFSDTTVVGCTVKAYDGTRATANRNFDMVLAPVQVTGGADAKTPDQFTVFYGSQNVVAGSTTLSTNMNTAVEPIRVVNRYGYRVGDLLVLLQAGKDCSMVEVTSVPVAPSDQLNHDQTGYQLDWAEGGPVGVTSRSNHPPGSIVYTGAGTAGATRVYNIGNLYDNTGTYAANGSAMPVYNTYRIESAGLTVRSAFSDGTTTPIGSVPVADNVVHMRVLYGMDDGQNNDTVASPGAAGDSRVDRYIDAATFSATSPLPWDRLVSVRVALVARSATPEKPSSGKASDPCDATTAAPTWSGADGTGGASDWSTFLNTALDLSADADWRCYRYRVFETTVPLRNWIWKSS
jgi:type IV pilus assembly protein PilW